MPAVEDPGPAPLAQMDGAQVNDGIAQKSAEPGQAAVGYQPERP